MAIDTAAKRKSLVGYGMPFRLILPAPDGTIAAPDRLHLLGLYSGISAATPANPTYVNICLTCEITCGINLVADICTALNLTAEITCGLNLTADVGGLC